MEIDGTQLRDGAHLDCDLCIIGAGPAGIALAGEFIDLDLEILMLESGGFETEQAAQQLNDGEVTGEPLLDLRTSRNRGAGGAMQLWNTWLDGTVGAKYAPLDPGDFVQRSHVPLSGWPFEASHLEPFYRRAQRLAGLGAFAYGGHDWADAQKPCLQLCDDSLLTGVYQFGPSRRVQEKLAALRESRNVAVCPHLTACALDSSRSLVTRVNAVNPAGARVEVRSRLFVLAAGALENCRLLLASAAAGSEAPGNRHGWVGRCFMEHPRDRALRLIPRSPDLFREAAFYDFHPARDGTLVCGRIALGESILRAQRLPNASVTLLPSARAASSRSVLVRLLERAGVPGFRTATDGYGWSRLSHPGRRFDAFQLLVNLEQHPHPDNRVVLTAERDAAGVPRAKLDWRWRAEEQAGLERLRQVVAEGLEAAGLGRVERLADLVPDPHAHHHAGTTRMHDDPRQGVIDADARVHGIDNLYVTGASAFPTSGFANPTLTVFALALRLADHLKKRA